MLRHLRKWFANKSLKDDNQTDQNKAPAQEVKLRGSADLELKGRTVHKKIIPKIGHTILDLATDHEIDWGSHCRRGTCARCRCYVHEGKEFLSEPNEAETLRLQPDEITEGYRLACQMKVNKRGRIYVEHKSYF